MFVLIHVCAGRSTRTHSDVIVTEWQQDEPVREFTAEWSGHTSREPTVTAQTTRGRNHTVAGKTNIHSISPLVIAFLY